MTRVQYTALHHSSDADESQTQGIGLGSRFSFMTGDKSSRWRLFARVAGVITCMALVVNLMTILLAKDPPDCRDALATILMDSLSNNTLSQPAVSGTPVVGGQKKPVNDEAQKELDAIQQMDMAVVRNRTFKWKKYDWPPNKEHSALAKNSAAWYDITDGQVHLPSTGMVMNVYNDLCFTVKSFHFVARDPQHYSELDYCCFTDLEGLRPPNCSSTTMKQCEILKNRPMIKNVSVWTREYVQDENIPVIEGNVYWMFTVGRVEHIGHMVNRMMQFFHVISEPAMPKIDFFFAQRASRPKGEHLKSLVDTVMGPYMAKSWWHDTMLKEMLKTLCFRRVFELDLGQGEQLFFTKDQAERWRNFSLEHFVPKDVVTGNCPPPVAAVLQREEGSGMRKILNYDVVERVLRANGIESYVNITIGGKNTTEDHVRAFSSFGLMVASHSSQLKNLLFAQRHAIVIETRGTPPGYMQPSPFSIGMDLLDVIYEESVGHDPDLSTCPEAHGCVEFKRYKTDYWLNEKIFDVSVKNALANQEAAGCGYIWKK